MSSLASTSSVLIFKYDIVAYLQGQKKQKPQSRKFDPGALPLQASLQVLWNWSGNRWPNAGTDTHSRSDAGKVPAKYARTKWS
jgi:hypothetical protein